MNLKAGSRWKSAADDTEMVIVRAPSAPVDLWCGGHPVIAQDTPRPEGFAIAPDHGKETRLGKRYADPDSGLEVLCTKGGAGMLSLGGAPLAEKTAKPLPSSD